LALLLAGWLWSTVFPLNKNLWTSSFVLWTGGWSALLLGLFYWVIDVQGVRRLGAVFAVIGMNSVLIYMAGKFIHFDYTARALFGGVAAFLPPAWGALLLAVGFFAVEWALLWFLKEKKVFLRV
jgi:predicted acyltransferase